jgi:O-methyltransferase involved in polyketide biosynthesis
VPVWATSNRSGETQYLDKPATETVLRAIAGRAAGTVAVVEFLFDDAECDELGSAFRSRAMAVAEQSGEPMISFYCRAEVEPLLARCGFRAIELLGARALATRYLGHQVRLRLPGAAIFAVVRA